jgi:methionyl aminopeptidase
LIVLKTEHDLERMRQAARILTGVLERLEAMVAPGVETVALEIEADRMIRAAGAVATFRGQHGLVSHAPPYPAATCISINEEVIHGIPSARRIRSGDIVSIDCGVTFEGYIADSAITVAAGPIPSEVERLVHSSRVALEAAIRVARPGAKLHDVSFAVQARAMAEGLGVVREYCGHGVGRDLHEDPPVPNHGTPGTGPVLRPGMTIAIEPMLTLGSPRVRVMRDGWTVVTVDGKPAAHVEHTIAITDGAAEVLTRRPHEVPPTL